MTVAEQRRAIRNIFLRQSYSSIDSAKEHIQYLMNIGVFRYPTLNDFLDFLEKERLPYGDDWGWSNLFWDILDANYGAKAIRDRKTRKTCFKLKLPPVERLTKLSTETSIKERKNKHETDTYL